MSLGILGGTFDPIHRGHLRLAEETLRRFGLSRVLLMPARHPPHKGGDAVVDWHHRLTMTALACHESPGLEVSAAEGSHAGRSYTVDTLERFRGAMAPEEPLFFLMGADSLGDLTSWREPERIVSLANLIVMPRPGLDRRRILAALKAPLRARLTDAGELADGRPPPSGSIFWAELPTVDISGSEIRRRVREGIDIGGLVPETVAVYISRYHLYR